MGKRGHTHRRVQRVCYFTNGSDYFAESRLEFAELLGDALGSVRLNEPPETNPPGVAAPALPRPIVRLSPQLVRLPLAKALAISAGIAHIWLECPVLELRRQ